MAHDEAGPLVAPHEEAEEQAGFLAGQRSVAQLAQDQHARIFWIRSAQALRPGGCSQWDFWFYVSWQGRRPHDHESARITSFWMLATTVWM